MNDKTKFKNMKKTILTLVAALCMSSVMAQKEKFELAPLPYPYEALEPAIDAMTMQIHHDKHHAGYVNNLNKAVTNTKFEKLSLEELLLKTSELPDAIRNNAGGHYNHSLFWTILCPAPQSVYSKGTPFDQAVQKAFGSLEQMKQSISEAVSKRFGSGWAWLYMRPDGQLAVSSTPNQDNPLMDVIKERGIPLLGIDVWEHAYYLKYQNKRGDYLEHIWKIINWQEVNKNYDEAMANTRLRHSLNNFEKQ